jgi:heme/copper-type cytochrome/quinol oxidase subunit 1
MDAVTRHLRALDQYQKVRAAIWIWLGVFALLAAGVMSVLLVLARTPWLQNVLPGTDFFHVALVVHVDLSVLVWFLACAGLVWTVFGATTQSRGDDAALGLAVVGTVMISVAPFAGAVRPLMNNYVPVLDHTWFYLGLGSLAAGLVLRALGYLLTFQWTRLPCTNLDMLRSALAVAAITVIVAVVSVGVSSVRMPEGLDGQFFFEVLFWGGGHVLQFTNTVLVLVAWLLLVWACGSQIRLPPVSGALLFVLVGLPLVSLPWLYASDVAGEIGRRGFTELMRWGGLAALPLVLILGAAAVRASVDGRTEHPLRAVLLCSMSLFAAGGLIGFMINGSNTMIPAHYHGSIVGVTLAFMGVVYYLLPQLGYAIKHRRLLRWQPYVYGSGQLLHITGLALSGGYGVQRKVAGSQQVLDGIAQTTGMGMMGLGGLLAAIGGLGFLIIVITALNGRRVPLDRCAAPWPPAEAAEASH